jgi:hypothetical protein
LADSKCQATELGIWPQGEDWPWFSMYALRAFAALMFSKDATLEARHPMPVNREQ